MEDKLGDRMKKYEKEYVRYLNPLLPTYVRIDGRNFSKFTKDLAKPVCEDLQIAMINTMMLLVTKTPAAIGYTQSDEISLVFPPIKTPTSQLFFGGKESKILSVLPSLTASAFASSLSVFHLRNKIYEMPHFDCRLCQLPNETETANMVLWRYNDATRNAILNTGYANFSAKEMHGKKTHEVLKMLSDKGEDFENFHDAFKYGTFAKKVGRMVELTDEDLAKIPEHNRPDGKVMRWNVERKNIPNFSQLKNEERVKIIFDKEEYFE